MDSNSEFEQRLNALQHEILDGRSKHIDWELARAGQALRTAAIIVATIGAIFTIASITIGLIAFGTLKALEAEALESVEEVKESVEEAQAIIARVKASEEEVKGSAHAADQNLIAARQILIKMQNYENRITSSGMVAEDTTQQTRGDQVKQTDDKSGSKNQREAGSQPKDSAEEG